MEVALNTKGKWEEILLLDLERSAKKFVQLNFTMYLNIYMPRYDLKRDCSVFPYPVGSWFSQSLTFQTIPGASYHFYQRYEFFSQGCG